MYLNNLNNLNNLDKFRLRNMFVDYVDLPHN